MANSLLESLKDYQKSTDYSKNEDLILNFHASLNCKIMKY